MPTYSARCTKCGNEKDYIAKVKDFDNTPTCCDLQMKRFMVAPMITAMGISDHNKTISPIDGRPLYGRSEYLAHLKQHNILPSSDLAGEAQHRMKAIKADIDTKKRETVAEVINTLGR